MKRISLLIAFFGLLFIVLPSLTAQDEKKKDADKADAKKDDEKKKDDAKTTGEPEKKKDKHKDEPKKEKLHYSYMKAGKVLSVNGRDLTVEVKEIDPNKQKDVASWQAQRTQQLAQQNAQIMQQYSQALTQKDANARANALQGVAKSKLNYQNDLAKFNIELAGKDIYSPKPWDIRAHEDGKVRTMILPVEFDDLGFEKKWTKKEIEERKDKTGLPGLFASDFDQLKTGQYVDVYVAKTPAKEKEKDQPKKKKGPDDDPVPEVKTRPEFILIVIQRQPAPPK